MEDTLVAADLHVHHIFVGVDIFLHPERDDLAEDLVHIALDTGRHEGGLHETVEILRLIALLHLVHEVEIGLCQRIDRLRVALAGRLEESLPLILTMLHDLRILRTLLDRKQDLAALRETGQKGLTRAQRHLHTAKLGELHRIRDVKDQRDA